MKKYLCVLSVIAILMSPLAFAKPQEDNGYVSSCLENLPKRTFVEEINFAECNIDDRQISRVITFIEAHPELTYVDLSRNELENAGAVKLAAMKYKGVLNLDHNYIADEGASAFSKSEVRALYLSGNPISDASAIALAKNQHIVGIDLNKTRISDKGVAAIATIPTLEDIRVEGNLLTDESAYAIAKSKTITSVYIMHNLLTNQGYNAINKMPQLVTFYYVYNPISLDQQAITLAPTVRAHKWR